MVEQKTKIVYRYQNDPFKTRYAIAMFIGTVWASFIVPVMAGYLIFKNISFSISLTHFLILTLALVGLYFLSLLSCFVVTHLGLCIINRGVPPRVGSFELSAKNRDARAWRARNILTTFCIWYFNVPHIDFLRVWLLRSFGLKIGKNVKLGRHVCADFCIEIGDNTWLAKNSIVSGHLIDGGRLILKKTRIGKNCIFDNWVGVACASVGDNSILLGKATAETKGRAWKGNGVYKGTPLRKIGNYSDLTPKEIEDLKKRMKKEGNIDFRSKTIERIKINASKLTLFKAIIVSGGLFAGFGLIYAFVILVNSIAKLPIGQMGIFLGYSMLLPFGAVIFIGGSLFGIGLFARLILSFYDYIFGQNIDEGRYDLDDPKVKVWKTKYLLKKYCLDLFHNSPIEYADSILLQVFDCKVSKNVKLAKSFLDPEFLEIKENTECAAFSTIYTHNIEEDKLIIKKTRIGGNVLVGGLAHIGAGVQIGSDTVVGIGAYVPDDSVLEPEALYMGNPARRCPQRVLK